jgi:hypothetical protein
VSIYVEPETQLEVESNADDTDEKEISMEEKRRLFYEKRLENITKCLRFIDSN